MAVKLGTQEGTIIKVNENEAVIESSFRRLLASIEAEREKIRSTWNQIEQEQSATASELKRLKDETEEWCYEEQQKITAEWKRLDKLRERMSVLWPSETEVLEINCSGAMFYLPKSALCSIEGSYLNHMFSDAFVQDVPQDSQGNFFLDFNPYCFKFVVDYLKKLRENPEHQPPPIPPEHQQNMDVLAEALRLKPFIRENRMNPTHGTSLKVNGDTVTAKHPGWQVISSEWPLSMASSSYFEIKIQANPDTKGGLAVGLMGHIPKGGELHTIRLNSAVLYVSNNGLIGDIYQNENVEKGICLMEGAVVGIRHDVLTRTVHWYHNKVLIGSCVFKPESLDKILTLYPIFALWVPGTQIQIDFNAKCPSSTKSGHTQPPDR